MFTTHPEDLRHLLGEVQRGELQLPDFQRDYVWDEDGVRALIASIARGFPVGALLTLETGGEVNFVPRPIEGAPKDGTPRSLLLDGQQRITSLYQALYCSAPVRTKNVQGNIVERHFYLDMDLAITSGADIQDAILSIPVDRKIKKDFNRELVLDLSSRENEVANRVFPLERTFDDDFWWDAWNDRWPDRRDQRQAIKGILRTITGYKMPLIKLDRSNSREAVCLVFEKVNVGGKKLDAFELVTAMFAADSFNLRDDWLARRTRLFDPNDTRSKLLKGQYPNQWVENTDFLQAITYLHTLRRRTLAQQEGVEGRKLPQVSIKRAELLELPLEAYQSNADQAEKGFKNAAGFVQGMRIFWARDLPYPPIRVALASLFAARNNKSLTAVEAEKVTQWFWAVSLGELYGSATETRIARDVTEILGWFDGGREPRSLAEASFRQDRLDQLQTRLSSAYKAIHALLMGEGCRDFWTGKSFELMTVHTVPVDIHHIFPDAWCQKQELDRRLWNSIVNKTPLSATTNRAIGGKAPSQYLEKIQSDTGIHADQMDAILRSHLIDPELMRKDDFHAFHEARREALTDLIAAHLTNPVMRGATDMSIELIDPDPEEIEAS